MYPYAEIILKKENQKHYNRKQHTNSHFKNKFIIFASCATFSDKNFRSHHILSRLDNFYFFYSNELAKIIQSPHSSLWIRSYHFIMLQNSFWNNMNNLFWLQFTTCSSISSYHNGIIQHNTDKNGMIKTHWYHFTFYRLEKFYW